VPHAIRAKSSSVRMGPFYQPPLSVSPPPSNVWPPKSVFTGGRSRHT
jgi:hypothetical protein